MGTYRVWFEHTLTIREDDFIDVEADDDDEAESLASDNIDAVDFEIYDVELVED